MLVLSRKKNESVVIGNEVTVTIVEVRGDKVRLGFTAPQSVPIHRQEVYDQIQAEAAARAAQPTVVEEAVAKVAPTATERKAKRKGRAAS